MTNYKPAGSLNRLLRSGLRFSEKLRVLDAHAAGETEEVLVKRIGLDLVFGRLWERMGEDGLCGVAGGVETDENGRFKNRCLRVARMGEIRTPPDSEESGKTIADTHFFV